MTKVLEIYTQEESCIQERTNRFTEAPDDGYLRALNCKYVQLCYNNSISGLGPSTPILLASKKKKKKERNNFSYLEKFSNTPSIKFKPIFHSAFLHKTLSQIPGSSSLSFFGFDHFYAF